MEPAPSRTTSSYPCHHAHDGNTVFWFQFTDAPLRIGHALNADALVTASEFIHLNQLPSTDHNLAVLLDFIINQVAPAIEEELRFISERARALEQGHGDLADDASMRDDNDDPNDALPPMNESALLDVPAPNLNQASLHAAAAAGASTTSPTSLSPRTDQTGPGQAIADEYDAMLADDDEFEAAMLGLAVGTAITSPTLPASPAPPVVGQGQGQGQDQATADEYDALLADDDFEIAMMGLAF